MFGNKKALGKSVFVAKLCDVWKECLSDQNIISGFIAKVLNSNCSEGQIRRCKIPEGHNSQ